MIILLAVILIILLYVLAAALVRDGLHTLVRSLGDDLRREEERNKF